MSQSHGTTISDRHFVSFTVIGMTVYYQEIFNHSQLGIEDIEVSNQGSFPLSTEPMPLPMGYGGWLAQHPVTKVLRCHKHRRNARKWMAQSHSDFQQCDEYWDKQQAKELAYQEWVEKKPTNYTSVNDPDFLAWCNEDPRYPHRKTNFLTPSPIDLEF